MTTSILHAFETIGGMADSVMDTVDQKLEPGNEFDELMDILCDADHAWESVSDLQNDHRSIDII